MAFFVDKMALLQQPNHFERGQVYWASTHNPNDHTAMRPAVILTATYLCEKQSTLAVAYLTSNTKNAGRLMTPIVKATGLDSAVMCSQPKTIRKSDIGDYLGTCSDDEMTAIEDGVLYELGISFNDNTPILDDDYTAAEDDAPAQEPDAEPDNAADTELGTEKRILSLQVQLDVYKAMYNEVVQQYAATKMLLDLHEKASEYKMQRNESKAANTVCNTACNVPPPPQYKEYILTNCA